MREHAVQHRRILQRLEVHSTKLEIYNTRMKELAETYAKAPEDERLIIRQNFAKMKGGAHLMYPLKQEAIEEFVLSCPRIHELLRSCVHPCTSYYMPSATTRLQIFFDVLREQPEQRKREILRSEGVEIDAMLDAWESLEEYLVQRVSPLQLEPLY